MAVHQRRRGDIADAERSLYQALELVSRAGDDPNIVAVWSLLIQHVAEQGRFDVARTWLPFGRAALARTGDAPRLASRWHAAVGNLLAAARGSTRGGGEPSASDSAPVFGPAPIVL